ncbi:uncharacterized protein LOC144138454 isoform X3 [Haemaphysalis longicornis]
MEFTHDVESELIALVEERPCLWNSKDVHYHNRHVKEMAMREITENLGGGFSESMVKSKWANLRSQFQREVRKIKESSQNGHPLDRYVPKWAHYQQLQFLRQEEPPDAAGYPSTELLPDNSMDHIPEARENDISPAMPHTPSSGGGGCVPLKRKCFTDNGAGPSMSASVGGSTGSGSFAGSRFRRESPMEDSSSMAAAVPAVGACRAFGLMMENCVSEIPEGPNRDLAMLVAYQALVRFKLTLNGHGSDAVDITLSELFRS